MNTTKKNMVIGLLVIGLILAIISFKTYFLDNSSGSGVRAAVTAQLQAQPTSNVPEATQSVPSTVWIHLPGNKH